MKFLIIAKRTADNLNFESSRLRNKLEEYRGRKPIYPTKYKFKSLDI
jgi:hypothetical protein